MKNNVNEQQSMSRRKFLAILGSGATAFAVAASGLGSLAGKASAAGKSGTGAAPLTFPPLQPKKAARLDVPAGFATDSVVASGKAVRTGGSPFGAGAGYAAYYPGSSANEGWLWIAHSAEDAYVSAIPADKRGASVIGVKRDSGGAWSLNASADYTRRLTGLDRIALKGPAGGSKALHNAAAAQGLWSNGSGGSTLWGTVLAGETPGDRGSLVSGVNPETCGWLTEADPLNPGFQARKHTALGRFAHGDAAVALSKDGKVVVYMGGEHALYKYISRGVYDPAAGNGNSALLEDGALYAADIAGGRWIELTAKAAKRVLSDPAYRVPEGVKRLREELLDMLQDEAGILVHAHEAALVLGATKLDRAFGVALHPADQSLFVAQTGSDGSGNGHGGVLRLVEDGGDAGAASFEADPMLTGGRQSGLSSPASIAFDGSGRLWAATAISPERLHQGAFAPFGNNGLYVLAPSGEGFGKAEAFAIAPDEAALAAPAFGPDGTLFASVRHSDGTGKHNSVTAIRRT